MSGAVQALGPGLRRVIVLRQLGPERWSVEGYEREAGRWQFTWLLSRAQSETAARRYAEDLACTMGLPVGVQRLGDRVRLVRGILGRVG